jgi:hypothetical protein
VAGLQYSGIFYDAARGSTTAFESCILRLERQLSYLYEKTLPGNKYQARAVCFELLCPHLIRYWRDLVAGILFDLDQSLAGCSTAKTDQPNDCAGLQKYHNMRSRRVGLVSSTRAFQNSHYRKQSIAVDGDNVIVNHVST